jgi:WD40 repeat protein
MVLVSAGGDGVLRVWSVGVMGHLMCTLEGAVGHLETVKDICVDAEYNMLALGDSSGHIRMWDVSTLDMSSNEALAASFKQV